MCLIYINNIIINNNLLSYNTVGPGNAIGELFLSSSSFSANAHLDVQVGPAVAHNHLSRDLNATSLLALNSLAIFQVHGVPVLSRVGPENTTGDLAITSSSSSFLTNADLYYRRRNHWSFCRRKQPAQQKC